MLKNQKLLIQNIPKISKNTIDPKADDLIKQLLQPDVNLELDPFGVLTHDWLKNQFDSALVNH